MSWYRDRAIPFCTSCHDGSWEGIGKLPCLRPWFRNETRTTPHMPAVHVVSKKRVVSTCAQMALEVSIEAKMRPTSWGEAKHKIRGTASEPPRVPHAPTRPCDIRAPVFCMSYECRMFPHATGTCVGLEGRSSRLRTTSVTLMELRVNGCKCLPARGYPIGTRNHSCD